MARWTRERRAAAQAGVILLLFLGYSGYYLCRSNLSVAMKAIEADLVTGGSYTTESARRALGSMVTFGILAYAIGKFFAGNLADTRGGRFNFLLGLAGSVACTVGFALGGAMPLFTMAWLGNRLFQSLGWVGAVKITSGWFSFRAYGTAMGLVSLSYLFGNWGSKQLLGAWLAAGLSWRQVFFAAAAVLAGLGVACSLLLRNSPAAVGLPEPEADPANVYRDRPKPAGLVGLWAPLARSPLFWAICALSVGLTFVREALNTWVPTYLQEFANLDPAAAARRSSWFDFWGGVSVVIAGLVGDLLGRRGRGLVILAGCAGAAWALVRLSTGSGSDRTDHFLMAMGLCLLGPYSYLAGAAALDLGGKTGGATAAGLIDGVGYLLGGVLAGRGVAELQLRAGWDGAFHVLAAVCVACAATSVAYLFLSRPARPSGSPDHAG